MSCVAHRNTKKNHHHVNVQTPDPSVAPAETIISFIRPPKYIMPKPEHICMGKIQLFLLPTLGLHTASTIGLQSNFNEYGYDASENTPIWAYDKCFFNKNGTDPVASPMGIPCKKYNRTSSRKFLLSCRGRSKKLEFGLDVKGVGGSSFSVKLSRLIKCVVGESKDRFLRRISRCDSMSPLV